MTYGLSIHDSDDLEAAWRFVDQGLGYSAPQTFALIVDPEGNVEPTIIQIHDDDLAERLGLPSAAARAKQVGLILDGYRASNQDRASLVDKMVEHAVHNARDEAVQRGITEASTSAVTDDGFPVLWSITWKIQSASWMLRNRRVIEAAIS